MRSSKVCLWLFALTSTISLAQVPSSVDGSDGMKVISDADKSQISANILCENIPVVKDPVAMLSIYSDYIGQVSDLFAKNSQDIDNNTIGINQDSQMAYTLISPVSIVGIDFSVVNINRLKDVNGNYYQITASKPLTPEDQGKIKNIPQNNKLTVSTKDQALNIICNIKVPMTKK